MSTRNAVRTRALVTFLTAIPLWLAGLILVAARNTFGWAEFFVNRAAQWTVQTEEGTLFYPDHAAVNETLTERILDGADALHG